MSINFMHFRNFRVRNRNHLIPLRLAMLMKKNVPKTIIDNFKKCEKGGIKTQTKMKMAAKWWLLSLCQKQTL